MHGSCLETAKASDWCGGSQSFLVGVQTWSPLLVCQKTRISSAHRRHLSLEFSAELTFGFVLFPWSCWLCEYFISQISSCICHIDLMSLAKKLTDTFFTKRIYYPYYNIFSISGGAHQEISSTLEKLKWLPLLNSVTTRVSIRLQPASDYLKISQSFLCLSTGYRH